MSSETEKAIRAYFFAPDKIRRKSSYEEDENKIHIKVFRDKYSKLGDKKVYSGGEPSDLPKVGETNGKYIFSYYK